MREDIMAQCYSQIEAMLIEQSVVALPVLRAIGDSTGEGGAFGRLLNLHFEHPRPGLCRCAAEVGEHLWNPYGVVHGGVTYALIDSAMAGAAISVLALGEKCMTVDMQVHYQAIVRRTVLVAEAAVTTRDGPNLYLTATVRSGEHLIATANGTFKVPGGPEKGE